MTTCWCRRPQPDTDNANDEMSELQLDAGSQLKLWPGILNLLTLLHTTRSRSL